MSLPFPTSQGELIRAARADSTQTEFARTLGVDRSCLSRYESEALGAPTSVINACLRKVAHLSQIKNGDPRGLQRSILLARELMTELDSVAGYAVKTPSEKSKKQ